MRSDEKRGAKWQGELTQMKRHPAVVGGVGWTRTTKVFCCTRETVLLMLVCPNGQRYRVVTGKTDKIEAEKDQTTNTSRIVIIVNRTAKFPEGE
jgi:hypothetical protein